MYTLLTLYTFVVNSRAYKTSGPKFQVWGDYSLDPLSKCYPCLVHPNLAQIEQWELNIKTSLEPFGIFIK